MRPRPVRTGRRHRRRGCEPPPPHGRCGGRCGPTSPRSVGPCGCSTPRPPDARVQRRSEEHTSELQSQSNLVCRLLLEKKKKNNQTQWRDSQLHVPITLVQAQPPPALQQHLSLVFAATAPLTRCPTTISTIAQPMKLSA